MEIPGWFTEEEVLALQACRLCPRNCGTDRFSGATGSCGVDAAIRLASVCIHRGEEPAVSGKNGICNLFFTGCNLSCSFCQNHQISCKSAGMGSPARTPAEVLGMIGQQLAGGSRAVGFVSPTHVFPQARVLLSALKDKDPGIITVWNSNAYEYPEKLEKLEGLVDLYLPDYKYHSPELGARYSGVRDYPERALAALREMYRQKGSTLLCDEEGQAGAGLIIRHLVLPGHADDSIRVLETIAGELSTRVAVSLMSQYYPPLREPGRPVPAGRLNREEYEQVVDAFRAIGFSKGWTQEPDSASHYQPDFGQDHPFE